MKDLYENIAIALGAEVSQDDRGFYYGGVMFPEFVDVIVLIMIQGKTQVINLDCVMGYQVSIELCFATGAGAMSFVECNHSEFSEFYYLESITEGLNELEEAIKQDNIFNIDKDIDDIYFQEEIQSDHVNNYEKEYGW